MQSKRPQDRASLRFADEVLKRFAFLLDSGFAVAETDPTFVQFKSPLIILNVFHGRRSYEIGLELASADKPADTYPLYYLLWLADPNYSYRVFQAESTESVAEGVRQLAERFKPCFDIGLLNDKDLFVKFERQSKIWSHEFAMEVNLQQAHRFSNEAWLKKDFHEVVKILSPYRGHLTPTDLNRLEYAEKHLKDTA